MSVPIPAGWVSPHGGSRSIVLAQVCTSYTESWWEKGDEQKHRQTTEMPVHHDRVVIVTLDEDGTAIATDYSATFPFSEDALFDALAGRVNRRKDSAQMNREWRPGYCVTCGPGSAMTEVTVEELLCFHHLIQGLMNTGSHHEEMGR